MRRFIIVIISLFVNACYYKTDSLDYDLQNQRFKYSSPVAFKDSIILHFNNDHNIFDINKLNNLKILPATTNELKVFRENNNHEQLIEAYPEKIYIFIIFLINNNASEQTLFEAMQTYLRYLTKDKTLK